MKRIIGAVVVVSLCATFSAMGQNRIGLFASGLTSPDDGSDITFGGGIKVESLLSKYVGIDFHAMYTDDSNIDLVSIGVGPVLVIPVDRVSLVASVGAAHCMPTDRDYESALGYYVGVGLRVRVGDTTELYIEGYYTDASGEARTESETTVESTGSSTTITTVTETSQVDFSLAGVNLGVLWRF